MCVNKSSLFFLFIPYYHLISYFKINFQVYLLVQEKKTMDSLNNMCSALVSINNILQKRNHSNDRSVSHSTTIDFNNEIKSDRLTEENFYRARLFNRTIEELPSKMKLSIVFVSIYFIVDIDIDEIQQLKSTNIHTIQDLLSRYLIHDTAEEFYKFLLQTFHLTKRTASTITNLFHQWASYNLDGIEMNEQINFV